MFRITRPFLNQSLRPPTTASVAGETEFQRGVNLLLASCEPTFIEQTVRLTNRQMNFLHALSDGLTSGFSEKAILDRYDLTSSSNVIRVREALLEKDMILQPEVPSCSPIPF